MNTKKAAPLTKEELSALPASSINEVRDAYYCTSDALYKLAEAAAHLGAHEREAVEQIKLAMLKLSHLGKYL